MVAPEQIELDPQGREPHRHEQQELESQEQFLQGREPQSDGPTPHQAPSGGEQQERAIVTLKLDSIQLPVFDGDLTTWEAFRDMFEYLIDKSPKLSDVVKFHQLRTHLKGMAFDTIRGYNMTGSNYKLAWEDVKKRFDRKEDIVDEYMRKFIGIPTVTYPANSHKLRVIVDTTNQMLRALPTFGVEISTWDPFLTLIIESKLDDETRMEWKHKKGSTYKPDVKEMLKWIDTRASELQPTSADFFHKAQGRH